MPVRNLREGGLVFECIGVIRGQILAEVFLSVKSVVACRPPISVHSCPFSPQDESVRRRTWLKNFQFFSELRPAISVKEE